MSLHNIEIRVRGGGVYFLTAYIYIQRGHVENEEKWSVVRDAIYKDLPSASEVDCTRVYIIIYTQYYNTVYAVYAVPARRRLLINFDYPPPPPSPRLRARGRNALRQLQNDMACFDLHPARIVRFPTMRNTFYNHVEVQYPYIQGVTGLFFC